MSSFWRGNTSKRIFAKCHFINITSFLMGHHTLNHPMAPCYPNHVCWNQSASIFNFSHREYELKRCHFFPWTYYNMSQNDSVFPSIPTASPFRFEDIIYPLENLTATRYPKWRHVSPAGDTCHTAPAMFGISLVKFWVCNWIHTSWFIVILKVTETISKRSNHPRKVWDP